MITFILLPLFALIGVRSDGDGDGHACSREWNPVCCPDPKHVEVPISEYREYSNVCEFSYGKDHDDSSEDAISCGYGTCPLCLCTMNYMPVCCDDGGRDVEYANDCEAECDGKTGCRDGPCDVPCPCTLEHRPVCCPDKDNVEFGNPCGAVCAGLSEAELIACHYGTCDRPENSCPACDLTYVPTCCDGIEYPNECQARCEGANMDTCTGKKCEIPCTCTNDYFPVCCPPRTPGAPRQTYGNSCAADCDGRTQAELLDCYYGECPACPCTMESKPVCCYGTEYGNQCEADCAGATGCSDDACDSDDSYGDDDDSRQGVETSESDSDDDDEDEDDKSKGKNKEDKPQKPKPGDKSAAFAVNSVQDCECEMDYTPTCCQYSDPFGDIKEVTYGNQCEADCDTNAGDCTTGECESSLCLCTREYKPVCCPRENGQPGEQFSNACTAACVKTEAELIDCKYGICEDQCACPFIEAPVCCGGKTYSNDCVARCSSEDTSSCTEGACATPCPTKYEPQCCDGEKEFGNKCMADANGGTGCESKPCDEPCPCTYEYIPVCCGDQTYGNKCQAECADEDLVACEYGACDELVCDCKEKEDPVCCHGDKEYRNKCLANCADDSTSGDVCQKGKCNTDQTVVAAPQALDLVSTVRNASGFSQTGVGINTVLLGLIFVAIMSFVCIYYKRTDPSQFRKQININYDTDQ